MAETTGLALINFETGDISQLTGTSLGSGNSLSALAAAAAHGSYGCKATYGGTAGGAYGYKTLGASRTELYSRFYFYVPTIFSQTTGALPYIAAITDASANIIVGLRTTFSGTTFSLNRMYYYRDSGTSTFVDITGTVTRDAWHYIELHFKASSAVGANDGIAECWYDGTSKASVTTVDSDTLNCVTAQMGLRASGVPTSDSYVYYDDFKLNSAYIGAYADSSSWYAQNGLWLRETSAQEIA